MNKEQEQGIKEMAEITWNTYCEMLDKTGGNIRLSLDLTGLIIKAILQPQPKQSDSMSTFFMGKLGQ